MGQLGILIVLKVCFVKLLEFIIWKCAFKKALTAIYIYIIFFLIMECQIGSVTLSPLIRYLGGMNHE